MKITLTKHGGWIAGMQLPPRVIDLSSLPKEVVEEYKKLIASAMASPGRAEANPGKARDAMSYTITIEGDGPPGRVQQSDTTMSEEFAALVQRIERS
jgi:hypothetical protein